MKQGLVEVEDSSRFRKLSQHTTARHTRAANAKCKMRPDLERPDVERPDVERPDVERPGTSGKETMEVTTFSFARRGGATLTL